MHHELLTQRALFVLESMQKGHAESAFRDAKDQRTGKHSRDSAKEHHRSKTGYRGGAKVRAPTLTLQASTPIEVVPR